MLIFQVNPNQLKDEVPSSAWLFWNTYLAERVKQNDYALLPDYIDFITDTEKVDDEQQFLVALDGDEDYTE